MSGCAAVTIGARVPIRLHPRPELSVQAEVISFKGLPSGKEHVAVLFGRPRKGCLVRIHSECLTGDVFGSTRCDCGPQLREALDTIGRLGGVILYMRQEGRGIGLYQKLSAYLIQDGGVDTFAANEALGHGADERSYDESVAMLRALGLDAVTLLTNNPAKVAALEAAGVSVLCVVPTGVHATPENAAYLQAKVAIAGHELNIRSDSA